MSLKVPLYGQISLFVTTLIDVTNVMQSGRNGNLRDEGLDGHCSKFNMFRRDRLRRSRKGKTKSRKL